MANREQLKLIKKSIQDWNAWRKEHPNEIIDLTYADLRRASLSKANLTYANLNHADLSGAFLSDADLREANFQDANLSEAHIFSGVDIRGANFNRAKLNGVHLPSASLSQASFFAADLRNVNLMGAYLLSDTDFREADLRGANLEDADLEGADLRGANLSKINLGIMYPRRTNFRGANLSYARIMEYGNHISGFDLSNTIFEQTNLTGADFHDANLSGANFCNANLQGINLSNANLQRASFQFSDLSGANLSGVDLSNINFQSANLSAANLQHTNLRGTNFFDADLSNVDLSSLDLREADLRNAILLNTNLHASQFLGANLSAATLTGACIADWHIGETICLSNVRCDYIFRTIDDDKKFAGRLPIDPRMTFAPSEFEKWIQVRKSALDTIDITFVNGINWHTFFTSLEAIRQQHPEAGLQMQSVQEVDGIYVTSLQLRTEVTGDPLEKLKALVESKVKAFYEKQLADAHGTIQRLGGKIEGLQWSLEQTLKMGSNQINQNFYGSTGNVAGTNYGSMTAHINQNNEAISQLIAALKALAQAFPTEQKDEVLMELEDLEADLGKPEKQEPKRLGKRLQRLLAAVTAAATVAGGAATLSGDINEFTDNVLELGEKIGITREQLQPAQENL